MSAVSKVKPLVDRGTKYSPWLVSEPIARNLHDELTDSDLRRLTVVPGKRAHYVVETFYREGLADAMDVLGDRFYATLHAHTLIVFKPDAIVGRRVEVALKFLRERSFAAVYGFPVQLNRLSIREDWRFQLNQLTLDRMRLNSILAEQGPALFVVLRDDSHDRKLPASVRLQSLKGPSYPHLQSREHLRHVLGSWSRLLKFIHTPDEPADILREMGIFLESTERRRIFSLMANSRQSDGSSQVARVVEQLYKWTAPHDLELATSISRIQADLSRRALRQPAVAEFLLRFEATVAECENGRHLAWRALEADMASVGIQPNWDFVVLGAAFIQHSFEDEHALIVGDGVSGWQQGEGVFVPETASSQIRQRCASLEDRDPLGAHDKPIDCSDGR